MKVPARIPMSTQESIIGALVGLAFLAGLIYLNVWLGDRWYGDASTRCVKTGNQITCWENQPTEPKANTQW